MEAAFVWYIGNAMRRERRFRDRLDPLYLSDVELISKYRFPRQELVQMFEELEPLLAKPTRRSNPLPTHTQVLLTLRLLASGSFQNIIGDTAGCTQSTVSRTVHEVLNILFDKSIEEVSMPTTRQEFREVATKFGRIRNFPNVIGAIDCTHVAIKAPTENEGLYVNRKRYHSINVQATCDADGIFTSYNARFPGSTHDSYIWRGSHLRQRFINREFDEYLLLGDSGYPLEPFLMTPFRNPNTPGEETFNRAHTSTRVIIEQCFGRLKCRFRCLHKSGGALQYEPIKCVKFIGACILLHNRCIKANIPLPQEDEEDPEDADDPEELNPRAQQHVGAGRLVRQNIVQNVF